MQIDIPPIKEVPPRTEFRTELLGIAAASPYAHHNSPGRQQMFTNSHLAQRLVVSGLTENPQNTFMRDALGKATFRIEMPVDAIILKVIDRYPVSDVSGSITINPERIVIYEEMATKRIGHLSIPRYISHHAYFGFELVPTKDAQRIVAGQVIQGGTVLYDSPGVSQTGRFMTGVVLQTAFMGHIATSEDGLIISRDVLPAFRHKRYEVRSIEWGEDSFPLNTFGDEDTYKIFPDIGEFVRDDGLLMAKRPFNGRMTPVDLSVNGVRRIDHIYDERLYAKGKGGRVVDVKVTLNYDYEKKGLPPINQQLEKYIRARNRFNDSLIEEFNRLKRVTHGNVVVTRKLHVLLLQAMIDRQQGKDRFHKVYRNVPIDHFRVDFVIEYDVEPNIGFKLTDDSGGNHNN